MDGTLAVPRRTEQTVGQLDQVGAPFGGAATWRGADASRDSSRSPSTIQPERAPRNLLATRHSPASYRIPMWALALGVVSLGLLGGTRLIDERRANDAALANVVMDLRIRVATAQLWTEEIESDKTGARRTRVESALVDAAHLAAVLAAGGQGDDLLFVTPPNDVERRARAEDVMRLTSEWRTLTLEALNRPRTAPGSPQDGRRRAVFDEFERRASDFERIIETEQVADITRSRRLFNGLFVTWSLIVFASATSLFRREKEREKADHALRTGRERLETMVAERTRALRSVNMALLTAQEKERRRISTELHDQLGHALILMKYRFALVARELTADQSKARAECADLCGYIDQTLEEVRRLARDLRPSVLEELGLSAALRWLADNCGPDGRPVAAMIADVDSLLPPDAQVVVYRIVQQALTNAAQHSEANHVGLFGTRDRDGLHFVVEDDGEGFDMSQLLAANPERRSLGLATMQERAAMIGGSLEVWSAPGKGTRVTLRIPAPQQEGT